VNETGASLAALMAVIATAVLTAGCNGGDESGDVARGPGASDEGTPTARPAEATVKTRCEVGERPGYYVPAPEDSPLAIIGCARLGASTKPVEFSANGERIGQRDHICLNPAYGRGGQLGAYIPNACVRDPVSRDVDVVSVEVPDQGVRGYQLVLWGTAAPSTRRVVARYHEGAETNAAVFPVRRPLARTAGATRPFSVFVVELDPAAVCVWVRATGASRSSTARVDGWPERCGSDSFVSATKTPSRR